MITQLVVVRAAKLSRSMFCTVLVYIVNNFILVFVFTYRNIFGLCFQHEIVVDILKRPVLLYNPMIY